jgi:HD-GYP domain-containing protein (c-di-GMP phosphodiesterase class II)
VTPGELNLHKKHVQRGYEFVMNINFPWPIPEVVLQPHERMDGSG